jgi:hypothetical protein
VDQVAVLVDHKVAAAPVVQAIREEAAATAKP